MRASMSMHHLAARIEAIIDSTGEYQCCRAIENPEVCEHCGYSTCAEIALARDWRPGSIRQLMRAY